MSEQQIVIVGGGFTGTALAIHLARRGPPGLTITVIEPRAQLGQGVAYSTQDPAHRINVPASRMQLTADEAGVFERWYRASADFDRDPAACWPDGNIYPQRSQFGRWVGEQFTEAQQRSAAKVVHVRDRAVAMHNGAVVTATGSLYQADEVVLAISHPPPALPALLQPLQGHAGLIANPWQSDALAAIESGDRVAIIGSGLTMSDMVASLHQQGHQGKILVFSRRGQLPRPNIDGVYDELALDYQRPQTASARGWLVRVRQEVAQAAIAGLPWQLVLDDIRRHGQHIWQTLSLREQRRFLRHLRPWWDVHRYRIAPQVSRVVDQQQISGQLRVAAARLKRVALAGDIISLTLQGRNDAVEMVEIDKVIVTTGPAHGALLDSDDLLRQLAHKGVIQADPLALGINVNALSQTLNSQGEANPHLYVVGPAARARFGELMGLPQVAEHAESLAQQLLHALQFTHRERCPISLN